MLPRSGDILRVGVEASVQFRVPILFRLIRVHDWPCADYWVWLDGYQLDASGDAVERRSIYVRVDGLQPVPSAVTSGDRPRPRSRAFASRR